MAVKHARWSVVLTGVIFLLVMPGTIYSCGPWFDEATFAFADTPQPSQADYAAGKLGIMLPTFRRSYLIIAYRYLNGMKLNPRQQQDAMDVWNRNMGPSPMYGSHPALDEWLKARSQVDATPPVGFHEPYAPLSDSYQSFLNCPDEAFRTAAATLNDRISKYGKDSNAVHAWVTAQDMVFSNCDGKDRSVPPAIDSGDAILRADRNYQIAAAQFYSGDFDAAAASFDTIAKDSSSPWSKYGSYLAVRALIRKATLHTPGEDRFDAAMMHTARQRLDQLAGDPNAPMHEATQRLLGFVRFRTEPQKRVAELEQLILKPDPGTNFKQNLWDYVLLASHGERADDLSDWLRTVYMETTYEQPQGAKRTDAQSAAEHAIAKWHENRSLPWLIAALVLNGSNPNPELLKAASQIPRTSPAYLTVRYYALRTMAKGNEQDAARKELDALLADTKLPAGSHNLLNDERQKLATNLADFLSHAAEIPTYVGFDLDLAGGEYPSSESDQAKASKGKPFFNTYAADVLAHKLPLTQLADSAHSMALPSHLQRELVRSTWTRAILLNDFALADHAQPLLEKLDHPLWTVMDSYRSARTQDDKRFSAIFLILKNPGLSPYLRSGLLRSATLGELDHFRDNWWCEEKGDDVLRFRAERPSETLAPSFLSAADRATLEKETRKLASAPVAANYLSAGVLSYAKAHPDDPRVPEALYWAVRSTRWGCTNGETTKWSEKAFRLLHQRYPKSEWAEKTKYYF